MPLEGANIQIRVPESSTNTSDLLRSISRSLGSGGGGGGAGATKFDYLFNPATGGYELIPHSNSNEITKRNLEALQQYRAKQAVLNDASIASKLKDFDAMSAEKQASTLDSIRTQDLPRLQKQTGIAPEELITFGLAEPVNAHAARRQAIDEQGTPGTMADTFLMGLGSFTDAIADMFSNTEEQLARAERRAESNQRIIERNPYLENRERQRAEGAGTLELLSSGGLKEAGALVGEFGGASGGPLILAGGGAKLATSIGSRLLPAVMSQASRAVALQRYGYGGAAIGGALGGAPAQQASITSTIANDPTLTREEKLAALERANLPARVFGAGMGSITLPVGAAANRALSSLRAQAGRGGSNVAQAVRARNAANGEIPAGASPTYWQDVLNNARARDLAAENARLTAPGIRGRLGRYWASLPDSMLESTAFGVGMNTGTNVIVGEATGRDYDPLANTGEAAISSALFGPLFNVMNSRPVRAVPAERLDARGNVITYERAPDGSVVTSAGIRQIGEDPALPNYSYIDTQSPWPRRTAQELDNEARADAAYAAAQTEAAAADARVMATAAEAARAEEARAEAARAEEARREAADRARRIHRVWNRDRIDEFGIENPLRTWFMDDDISLPARVPGSGSRVLTSKTAGISPDDPVLQYFEYLYRGDSGATSGGVRGARAQGNQENWAADFVQHKVPVEYRRSLYNALENVLYNSTNASLRNHFNDRQINMMTRAHETLGRLLGADPNMPSSESGARRPSGTSSPLRDDADAASRKIGGGKNILKSKTDGIAKDSSILPYYEYLYKGVFADNPGLNRPSNSEIRERWAADYARYEVPSELRQPLYDALDNVLYNSTNASLRNYFNNNQINMMARAHESLARVIGEQNAQNSATAGDGSQSGGTGEQAASLGGSDIQGAGRTPDTNIPADSGESTNAAGAPEAAPEQLSGSLVDGGTAAQERGNVVPAPQDTGASATTEGTAGATTEPATGAANGESGAGPAATPDAAGSPSAGSAEPAAGARTGDDGNVADAGGDAESGVAPQPERVVNSADLDTLVEDAATNGGTVAHAAETNAEPNAPTDSEIIAAATTHTEPPTEAAPAVTQHPQTLEEKAAVYERGTNSGGTKSRGKKSRAAKYRNPEEHRLDLPESEEARRIRVEINEFINPVLEHEASPALREEFDFPINRASIEALMNPDRRTFETKGLLAATNWALHTRPELADELYHALLKRVETDPNTAMFVRDDEGVALNNDANREWAAFNRLYDLVRDIQTVDETPPVSLGAYRHELSEAAAGNDVSASTRRPAEDAASAADLRGSEAEANPSEAGTSVTSSALEADEIAAYDAIPNKKLASQLGNDQYASNSENALMALIRGDVYDNHRKFIKEHPDKLIRSPIGTIAETRQLIEDLRGLGIDVFDEAVALQGRIQELRPRTGASDADNERLAVLRQQVEELLQQHGLKLKKDGYTIAPRSNKTRAKTPAPVEPTPAPKAKKTAAAQSTVTRMTRSEVPFETDAEINTTAGIMQSRDDVLSDRFAPKNITAKKTVKKNIKGMLDFARSSQQGDGGMTLDEALARAGAASANKKINIANDLVFKMLEDLQGNPATKGVQTKLRRMVDTVKWLEAIAMQNNHTSRLRNFSDGEWKLLNSAYRTLYKKLRGYYDIHSNLHFDEDLRIINRGDDVWLDDFLAAGSDRDGVGELHSPYDKLPTSDAAQNVEGTETFARLIAGPLTKETTWEQHTQQTLFSRSLENISTRADLLHTLVSRAALTSKETFEKLFTPAQRNAMNEAYQNLRKRVQLLPDNAPENLDGWQGRWLGSGGPEYRSNTPEARAILFPRAETIDRPSGSVFNDGVSEPGTAGAALDTMPDSAVRHFVSRMGMYSADRTAPISGIRETFDMQDMPTAAVLKGLDNDAAIRLLEKEAMFNYLGEGYEQLTPKEQKQVDYLHTHGAPYLRSELDAATIHDQVREIEAVTGEKMDFDTFYRNFLDPEDPAGPTRLAQDKFRTEC